MMTSPLFMGPDCKQYSTSNLPPNIFERDGKLFYVTGDLVLLASVSLTREELPQRMADWILHEWEPKPVR